MAKENHKSYDWPGWFLVKNPYGEHFNLLARKRMVKGKKALLPFIRKYKKKLGVQILEVGPFFNPLVSNRFVSYMDNDKFVLNYLKQKMVPIYKFNLNSNTSEAEFNGKFTSIIVSQVFNYIDYSKFLKNANKWLKPKGCLFVNNVINYGIPQLFSKKRPKTILKTVKAIQNAGFKIIEHKIIQSPYKKFQPNDRLI
jgi:hypothetical protein